MISTAAARKMSDTIYDQGLEIARLNKLLESTIEWYKLPGVVVSQKLEIARLGRIKTAAQALVEAMETCHICSVQMEFLTCCGIPDLHAALKAVLEPKC